MKKRQQGFTLIELLVTSSVIAVVAAMAVPSFKNARKSSNESSAMLTMRSIALANETYRVRFGTYPPDLQSLEDSGLVAENLGDLEDGELKAGYEFAYTPGVTTWSLTAEPDEVGQSGNRYFFMDTKGIIRFEDNTPAGPTSPAIGN